MSSARSCMAPVVCTIKAIYSVARFRLRRLKLMFGRMLQRILQAIPFEQIINCRTFPVDRSKQLKKASENTAGGYVPVSKLQILSLNRRFTQNRQAVGTLFEK
jgi:hypothetical protein